MTGRAGASAVGRGVVRRFNAGKGGWGAQCCMAGGTVVSWQNADGMNVLEYMIGMTGVAVIRRFGGDDCLDVSPHVRSVAGGAVIGMHGLD